MVGTNILIIHITILLFGAWNGYKYCKNKDREKNIISYIRLGIAVGIIILSSGVHNLIDDEFLNKVARVLFQIHWLFLINVCILTRDKETSKKFNRVFVVIIDLIYIISLYFLFK